MITVEQLRERGSERLSLTTTHGVFAGYLNQPLLTDGVAYALIGESLETAPDEAIVVPLEDISAVTAA
jgi:phosphoribosylpyrophosphate synthetase